MANRNSWQRWSGYAKRSGRRRIRNQCSFSSMKSSAGRTPATAGWPPKLWFEHWSMRGLWEFSPPTICRSPRLRIRQDSAEQTCTWGRGMDATQWISITGSNRESRGRPMPWPSPGWRELRSKIQGTDRMDKASIVGGMFGLAGELRAHSSALWCLNGHELLLANARSGIAIAYDRLRPGQVWMPSYLCGTMLQGITDRSRVRFYAVDGRLEVSRGWLSEVSPNDLAVFIDYFGTLADRALLQEASARGAWVLEDASQALLTRGAGEFADLVVFSPRKFLGVPDGGVLVSSRPGILGEFRLSPAPPGWRMKTLAAVVMRREFDLYGGERPWFTLSHEIEHECPVGYY